MNDLSSIRSAYLNFIWNLLFYNDSSRLVQTRPTPVSRGVESRARDLKEYE